MKHKKKKPSVNKQCNIAKLSYDLITVRFGCKCTKALKMSVKMITIGQTLRCRVHKLIYKNYMNRRGTIIGNW